MNASLPWMELLLGQIALYLVRDVRGPQRQLQSSLAFQRRYSLSCDCSSWDFGTSLSPAPPSHNGRSYCHSTTSYKLSAWFSNDPTANNTAPNDVRSANDASSPTFLTANDTACRRSITPTNIKNVPPNSTIWFTNTAIKRNDQFNATTATTSQSESIKWFL